MQSLSGNPLSFVTEKFSVHLIENKKLSQIADRVVESWESHRTTRPRQCQLAPRFVIWLIILMALYRDLGVPKVYRKMISIIKEADPSAELKTLTPTAMVKARKRLGDGPMEAIFKEQSSTFETEQFFHGFRVWAIDGSEFTIPDTPENVETFGRRKDAGYPSMTAVVLLDVYGRRVRDCVWTGWREHEVNSALSLIDNLKKGDLVLQDRGFGSFPLFWATNARKVSFLGRISSLWKPRTVKVLSDGDEIAIIKASTIEKAKLRKLGLNPHRQVKVRILTFTVGNGETTRLITTLLDDKKYPKEELAKLYHYRWDIEVSFDEQKNELFRDRKGKQHTHFRSKSPEMIRQEAWGLLLCYNLVRELMVDAASEKDINPLDISFSDTVATLDNFVHKLYMPLNKQSSRNLRGELLESVAENLIERRRRERACTRYVKKKMSKFPRKKLGEKCDIEGYSTEIVFQASLPGGTAVLGSKAS
jgi:hypothetical protein